MNLETLTSETFGFLPPGWEVRISYDEYATNPREDCNAWTIATVRDRRGLIPVDEPYALQSVPADAEMVLPVFYTPGPSGQGIYSTDTDAIRWNADPDLWPALQIGLAYLPAGTLAAERWTREHAADYLRGELATYTQWANGDVYAWGVFYRGHYEEGCSGYYELDDCRDEAIQAAIWMDRRQREAAADLQKTAILAGLGHN